MTQRIYKYRVVLEDVIHVPLHRGAKPLHFGLQNGDLYLWALINLDMPTQGFRFRVLGTGRPIDEPLGRYINTVMFRDGELVFHFFEEA